MDKPSITFINPNNTDTCQSFISKVLAEALIRLVESETSLENASVSN